jgi:hypothetical protein
LKVNQFRSPLPFPSLFSSFLSPVDESSHITPPTLYSPSFPIYPRFRASSVTVILSPHRNSKLKTRILISVHTIPPSLIQAFFPSVFQDPTVTRQSANLYPPPCYFLFGFYAMFFPYSGIAGPRYQIHVGQAWRIVADPVPDNENAGIRSRKCTWGVNLDATGKCVG